MTLKEISRYKTKVINLINGGRLYEAIVTLSPVIEEIADYDLTEQFNVAKVSYDYMLQYFVEGIEDSGRNEMLKKITSSLYVIADMCVISLSASQSSELFYIKSSTLNDLKIGDLVSKYQNLQNRLSLLESVPAEQRNERAISTLTKDSESVAVDMFNKLWCEFPLSNESTEALKLLFTGASEHVKQLMLSALLLGQTKFYDESKLCFMLSAYLSSATLGTQTRALTGAFLVMLLYPKRVALSERVKGILAQASELPNFKTDANAVMQRLVRSRNAEKVSKLMQEELMPNIMKFDPSIASKLRERRTFDPTDFEENPQWQEWLNKSGVSKKIEEFSQLQLEGEDVFISTFSKLKSFPFFNVMANWFLPFYPSHSSLIEKAADTKSVTMLIQHAPFLCDSDKYSFCFSLSSIPEEQKKAMAQQFSSHDLEMRELKASQLPDNELKKRDASINSYIQSIYRFFTLFSRRFDFLPVFKQDMDFTKLPFPELWKLDKTALLSISEYYMKNGFYEDALKYFVYIQKHYAEIEPHVFQKTGFAYQNLGEYETAIKWYKRYELYDDADLWNNRHIAVCYRQLRQFQQALHYYEKALSTNGENASLNLNAGHCLLELQRPKDALNFYYKADYLLPYSIKIYRAIAWANFLIENYELSHNYYNKIFSDASASAQDYLNYGHLLLAEGDIANAVKNYAISANGGNEQLQKFQSAFADDIATLKNVGITDDVIVLVQNAIIKTLNDK